MTAPTISRRRVWLRRCACAAGTVAVLLGMVALGESALDLKLWASVLPGHRAMLPLTAVTLVLAGLALLLRCYAPARRGASRVATVCALAVTLVGVLALFIHTLHWNIAIGGATLLDAATLDRAILHAHPLPPAEVGFVLVGLALLKMDAPGRRARMFAQLVALTALFGGLLASTGYVFGVVHPSSVASLLPYAGVPLDTVAALVVLSAGILAARSDHGLVALLAGGARGGVTRRLVYVLLAIPLVLGSTVWAGLGTGYYDVPLGFALLIAASTGLVVALAAVAVRELEQTDVRRQQTEAQYRSLVELAPDAVVVSDRDGRIVLVNSAAEWLFGYRRDELLGRPVETLMPEDLRQRHVDQRAAYYAGVAAKPMGVGIEYRCLRGDGRAFPAEISVGTVENGSDVLVTAVIRDVTQRQRDAEALRASEQRFHTLMDSMSDIVFTLDREQRFVEIFGRPLERYGVHPERFITKTAREILGADAAAIHEAANRRALAGER
ncbi:MAG: PAS domain S-box protein, partial [Chloroflexi bacterium]|nr:PAS domain S-box protein [Chloroflexota bacterium]